MYCTNVRNYVIKIHVFDYLAVKSPRMSFKHMRMQVGFHECHLFSVKQLLLRCAINQPCFHETQVFRVNLIFHSTAVSTVTLQQMVLQSVSDK